LSVEIDSYFLTTKKFQSNFELCINYTAEKPTGFTYSNCYKNALMNLDTSKHFE